MKRGLEYLGAVVAELRRCGEKAGEKVAKKEKKSTGSRASSRAAGTCCCVTNCARSAGQ